MNIPSASRTAKSISLLQIQGATSIACAALRALSDTIHSSKAADSNHLLNECFAARKVLESARETEPFLANSMEYALEGADHNITIKSLRNSLLSRIAFILESYKRDHEYIADLVSRKVPRNGIIFTHCHSSTVVAGLVKSWRSGIRFTVHNTEARPLYQGRKTATELSKVGIPVIHWVDSAAMDALHRADLALFGCDAIYTDGVANKVGTRLFCHAGRQTGTPSYVCTHSLKFDTRSLQGRTIIEERAPGEIWAKAPNGVRVMNPAFDIVEPEYIDGIISEHGVLSHSAMINQTRQAHPWLFRQSRMIR